MYTAYTHETIARQRQDETARQARTAHQRQQIGKTGSRSGRPFPKVTFPRRPRVVGARSA
jgi:hypothetical protein